MPPARKRKVGEDDDEPASQAAGPQQPLTDEVAEELANRLCRFVLLREHTRKPVSRTDIKDQVMPEHKAQDRTGRIFKQVLGVANEKLKDIAGLELVSEQEAGAEDDAEDADAGGASQSQAATQASSKQAASATVRYLIVNRLEDAVTAALESSRAIYLAFVEVVIALITENQGVISEQDMFGYLSTIGLEKEDKVQGLEEYDKVETLVQKRLVSEAFVRRRKNQRDAEKFEYLIGARAILNRDQGAAKTFVDGVKDKQQR